MSEWVLSWRAMTRLYRDKRFWFGPDRLGAALDVMEWISAEQTPQRYEAWLDEEEGEVR